MAFFVVGFLYGFLERLCTWAFATLELTYNKDAPMIDDTTAENLTNPEKVYDMSWHKAHLFLNDNILPPPQHMDLDILTNTQTLCMCYY